MNKELTIADVARMAFEPAPAELPDEKLAEYLKIADVASTFVEASAWMGHRDLEVPAKRAESYARSFVLAGKDSEAPFWLAVAAHIRGRA